MLVFWVPSAHLVAFCCVHFWLATAKLIKLQLINLLKCTVGNEDGGVGFGSFWNHLLFNALEAEILFFGSSANNLCEWNEIFIWVNTKTVWNWPPQMVYGANVILIFLFYFEIIKNNKTLNLTINLKNIVFFYKYCFSANIFCKKGKI